MGGLSLVWVAGVMYLSMKVAVANNVLSEVSRDIPLPRMSFFQLQRKSFSF